MSLYRVVVSFMREHMQFMAERGVKAMTPGQALNDVLDALQVDQSRIESLKCMVSKPRELDEFSEDAKFMACVGTSHSVKDIWNKRYGA